MTANIIYDNIKDRELLEVIPNQFPIFVNFINFNSISGRKEGYRIKSHWGARKNPFITIEDNGKVIDVFYSEEQSAVQQLIKWLNDSSKIQKT